MSIYKIIRKIIKLLILKKFSKIIIKPKKGSQIFIICLIFQHLSPFHFELKNLIKIKTNSSICVVE